jgi:hypothetical protein
MSNLAIYQVGPGANIVSCEAEVFSTLMTIINTQTEIQTGMLNYQVSFLMTMVGAIKESAKIAASQIKTSAMGEILGSTLNGLGLLGMLGGGVFVNKALVKTDNCIKNLDTIQNGEIGQGGRMQVTPQPGVQPGMPGHGGSSITITARPSSPAPAASPPPAAPAAAAAAEKQPVAGSASGMLDSDDAASPRATAVVPPGALSVAQPAGAAGQPPTALEITEAQQGLREHNKLFKLTPEEFALRCKDPNNQDIKTLRVRVEQTKEDLGMQQHLVDLQKEYDVKKQHLSMLKDALSGPCASQLSQAIGGSTRSAMEYNNAQKRKDQGLQDAMKETAQTAGSIAAQSRDSAQRAIESAAMQFQQGILAAEQAANAANSKA